MALHRINWIGGAEESETQQVLAVVLTASRTCTLHSSDRHGKEAATLRKGLCFRKALADSNSSMACSWVPWKVPPGSKGGKGLGGAGEPLSLPFLKPQHQWL